MRVWVWTAEVELDLPLHSESLQSTCKRTENYQHSRVLRLQHCSRLTKYCKFRSRLAHKGNEWLFDRPKRIRLRFEQMLKMSKPKFLGGQALVRVYIGDVYIEKLKRIRDMGQLRRPSLGAQKVTKTNDSL